MPAPTSTIDKICVEHEVLTESNGVLSSVGSAYGGDGGVSTGVNSQGTGGWRRVNRRQQLAYGGMTVLLKGFTS